MTTTYKDIDYKGYNFSFLPAQQGFRLRVTKDGAAIYDYQMLLQTQFEALASAAAEIFGESVEAESIAQAGKIPMRFYDDADCITCDGFWHYEEMVFISENEYQCFNCNEKGQN